MHFDTINTTHWKSLQWRHSGRDGVLNHQPHDCLLNRLFRRRSKKTSKLRITGLCEGNSPVTGEFPSERVCTAVPFDDVIMISKHDPCDMSPLSKIHYCNNDIIVNTLRPRRNGCRCADGIFKNPFLERKLEFGSNCITINNNPK